MKKDTEDFHSTVQQEGNMLKGLRRDNVLRGFLLSHLAVGFCVLMAALPMMTVTQKLIRDKEIALAQNRFHTNTAYLSAAFRSMEDLLILCNADRSVSQTAVYTEPLSGPMFYRASEALKLLRYSTQGWTLSNEVYLFFSRNNVILSPQRCWFSYNDFYGDYVSVPGMSGEDWETHIRAAMKEGKRTYLPEERFFSFASGGERSVLLYMLPFPNLTHSGMLMVVIGTDELTAMLNPPQIFGCSDCFLMVSDPEGQALYTHNLPSGKNAKSLMTDAKYTVFSYTDTESGLTYSAGMATSLFGQFATKSTWYLAFFITAAGLIGLIVSALLAYCQYRPVQHIHAAVREITGEEESGRQNEYEHFLSSFLTLNQKVQYYHDDLQSYVRQQKEQALESILKKRYGSKEELLDLTRRLGYPLPCRVVLCCAELSEDADAEDVRAKLLDDIPAEWSIPLFLHASQTSAAVRIAFITPNEEYAMLNRRLEELEQRLHISTQVDVFFAASSPLEDWEKAARGYEEAKALLSMRHTTEKRIVFTEDVECWTLPPILSPENATRLRETIRTGNTAETHDFIRLMLQPETISSRVLQDDDYAQVYYFLRAVLLGLRTELDSTVPELPFYSPEAERDELSEALVQAGDALAQSFSARKKSHNAQLALKMREYLENNYSNPELYGKYAAEHFEMNEKYLYSFFKEQLGVSFAAYLENLRLTHAAELLRTTDESMSDISLKSGYHSTNTFYKAFRRIYHVTPSEYRNSKKEPLPDNPGNSPFPSAPYIR
ncbi:MAG: helix-turn-helix domain-containing protein [Eubacteriales bacterium]|nr:helix-turn-helix domain-containing protein [Eubacteriales bacterium]